MGGSIFAAIAIWGFITSRSVPTNIAYLALAVTFVWAGFRAWTKEAHESARLRLALSSLPSTQSEPERRGLIFVNENPSFLTKFFDGHTSIQAKALLQPYLNKWMRIPNVTVFDISETGMFNPRPRVSGKSDDGTFVFMNFEEPWHEQILILRAGSVIEIIGQIELVDQGMISFGKCEILSAGHAHNAISSGAQI
ncbi:MAG: hypothetical protein ABSG41_01050 [Bryobacteraceae bacterium]|jgi:hypothetical protein